MSARWTRCSPACPWTCTTSSSTEVRAAFGGQGRVPLRDTSPARLPCLSDWSNSEQERKRPRRLRQMPQHKVPYTVRDFPQLMQGHGGTTRLGPRFPAVPAGSSFPYRTGHVVCMEGHYFIRQYLLSACNVPGTVLPLEIR